MFSSNYFFKPSANPGFGFVRPKFFKLIRIIKEQNLIRVSVFWRHQARMISCGTALRLRTLESAVDWRHRPTFLDSCFLDLTSCTLWPKNTGEMLLKLLKNPSIWLAQKSVPINITILQPSIHNPQSSQGLPVTTVENKTSQL